MGVRESLASALASGVFVSVEFGIPYQVPNPWVDRIVLGVLGLTVIGALIIAVLRWKEIRD